MTDDKKRQPYEDDQQKGGEATVTDQDVSNLTDTEVGEDTTEQGDETTQTESDNDLPTDENKQS